MKKWCCATLPLALMAALASAQTPATDLTQVDLEDLLNLRVTTASKKEQKIARTAAAIYVISQEDIRHSGATSIPEILRIVPGLEVARIDASKWAITSRGFNGRFANKMLVLVGSTQSISTAITSSALQDSKPPTNGTLFAEGSGRIGLWPGEIR